MVASLIGDAHSIPQYTDCERPNDVAHHIGLSLLQQCAHAPRGRRIHQGLELLDGRAGQDVQDDRSVSGVIRRIRANVRHEHEYHVWEAVKLPEENGLWARLAHTSSDCRREAEDSRRGRRTR